MTMQKLLKIFGITEPGSSIWNSIPMQKPPSLLALEGKDDEPRADYYCTVIDLYLERKITYQEMHAFQSNKKGNMKLLKVMGLV